MASEFPFTMSQVKEIQPRIIQDALLIDQFLKLLAEGKNFSPRIDKEFLRSFVLNYNTSYFVNLNYVNAIDKVLSRRRENVLECIYSPENRTESTILIVIFYFIKSLVRKDQITFRKMICISPMEPYYYFLLSECFSPYVNCLENLEKKDKNIRRATFVDKHPNGSYSFVCEKIWGAFASNTMYVQHNEYRYPFPHQEPDFTTDIDSFEMCKGSPLLFISTPGSGTQSIIYFLTWATGSKFRQFDRFRIFQRKDLFIRDIQTCIEGRFHIHSHYPIPEYGMKLLIESGYKVFYIDREIIDIVHSNKKHKYKRPSYYPIVMDQDMESYRDEITKFTTEFCLHIIEHLRFNKLESDYRKFFSELNDKYFFLSKRRMKKFFEEYESQLVKDRLNFRRNIL